jgi:hypothetical protein
MHNLTVALAITLVHWFTSGSVTRRKLQPWGSATTPRLARGQSQQKAELRSNSGKTRQRGWERGRIGA